MSERSTSARRVGGRFGRAGLVRGLERHALGDARVALGDDLVGVGQAARDLDDVGADEPELDNFATSAKEDDSDADES